MKREIALVAALAVATLSSATAEVENWGKGYLTFHLDNDLFGGTDKNYTNGARISWISSDRDPDEFSWIQRSMRKLSGDDQSLSLFEEIWGFDDLSNISYQYGVAFTQLMFTPSDPYALTPPEGERPYAGWAGLGASLHVKDENAMHSVELVVGILGPHAYARETQNLVHDSRNIDRFEGWDSQIPDEVTGNMYFTHRRRLRFLESGDVAQFSVDGLASSSLALGTFRTSAQLGVLTRFGWNLPYDFSDPRLSETANTQRMFVGESQQAGRWSLYGIAGARMSGVLHDATLDGPVFREYETGVTREPFVAEFYAGFGVSYDDWEFSYVHTFRSEEYESQEDWANFGSVAIRYRF